MLALQDVAGDFVVAADDVHRRDAVGAGRNDLVPDADPWTRKG